jgi:DNA-binding beta-propeller fold protein YncE
MLLLLLACATKPPADDTGSPVTCASDLSVGDVVPLATGFAAGTEGIAFSGGHLYVSEPDGVDELSPDGTVSRVATLDHALGLAPADGGVLVADPGEFTMDGSGSDGRLLSVSADGTTEVLAEGMPNPNFVATVGDTILVSDDTGDTIWSAANGAFAPWVEGIPSPNGMALSPDGAWLWVATTFATDPPLSRIPATSGEPAAVTTFDTGTAPDGLVVDHDGGVWVALNLAGEIVRIDPDSGEETGRVSGLTNPASLAFGDADGFDPCSLYVTSLYGDTVSRVAVGRR